MTLFDATLLARIQFAFTISFHIIFPAFTIGLASFLAVLEWRYLRTNDEKFLQIYKFFVKIFAITFAMGVVSGIVMSYEFGTNWSVFSYKTSNVLGPLLGFEVLTAFFLEASFLGIMLFGINRVSKKMHFAATCVVAVGTLISAFWILSANSFMQTPQGFEIGADGRLNPTSWFEIIFNPSFVYRFFHMILAAYLTTALVVGGIAAFYLWQKRHINHAKTILSMSLLLIFFVAPLQIFVGDLHGLNTLKHQPAKVAAMEGIWEDEISAPLRIFAIPSQKEQKNSHEIVVPKLASLILTHDKNGEIKGLKSFGADEIPPVLPVFFSFRIMVGIGVLMLILAVVSAIQYFRGKLFDSKFMQFFWMLMMPSGFIALLAGWFVTEIGRQPYVIYGVLRTADTASPAIQSLELVSSLVAFVVVYIFVFGAGSYYILKLINKGISHQESENKTYYARSKEALITHKKGGENA